MARVAASLGALGDDDVGAGGHVALGVHLRAGQGCHCHPGFVAAVDHLTWWRAEGVGHEGRAVGQGDVQLADSPIGREWGVTRPFGPPGSVRVLRHAVALEQLVEEIPVGARNGFHQISHGQASLVGSGVSGRDDEVHSERTVADLVSDPRQVGLQCLVAVGHRPQHAESTGPGHSGHHVTAVCESHDWELDAE